MKYAVVLPEGYSQFENVLNLQERLAMHSETVGLSCRGDHLLSSDFLVETVSTKRQYRNIKNLERCRIFNSTEFQYGKEVAVNFLTEVSHQP